MPTMVREEHVYEQVDVADVPLDVWLAGTRARHFCEDDLGIKLQIQWIREVSPYLAEVTLSMARLTATFDRMVGKVFPEPQAFRSKPIAGQIGWIFNDGTMKVRCDLSPAEVIRTVVHEAKHIHDSQHFRPPWSDEESAIAEARATAYEQRVWAQLADGAGAQRS